MIDFEKISATYPEAVKLVHLAENAWSGSMKTEKVFFKTSEKVQKELSILLEKNITEVFITDSDARHIKNEHGAGEALQGQVDIVPEYFALIPLVMNEFDTAEHSKNALTDWRLWLVLSAAKQRNKC